MCAHRGGGAETSVDVRLCGREEVNVEEVADEVAEEVEVRGGGGGEGRGEGEGRR